MNKEEANQVVEALLARLRSEPYQVLVERYLAKSDHRVEIGETGATYQVEGIAVWDSGKIGDLRVFALVDDGSRRSGFAPLTNDFIMRPDGSLVGE